MVEEVDRVRLIKRYSRETFVSPIPFTDDNFIAWLVTTHDDAGIWGKGMGRGGGFKMWNQTD